MSYIEVAWRRDAAGVTHIDKHIKELLGYTAQEIKNFIESASLTPWVQDNFKALLQGAPNSIAPHTLAPCPLRRKDGRKIQCEVVAICRYDERGCLAELFGMVRNYPHQELLGRFLDRWLKTGEAEHEAVCALMDLFARRA